MVELLGLVADCGSRIGAEVWTRTSAKDMLNRLIDVDLHTQDCICSRPCDMTGVLTELLVDDNIETLIIGVLCVVLDFVC